MTRRRALTIKRRALAYMTDGMTRKGNPRHIWVALECGHVTVHFYSARLSLICFVIEQADQDRVARYPTMGCGKCPIDAPADVGVLGRFPARKVMAHPELERFFTPGVTP